MSAPGGRALEPPLARLEASETARSRATCGAIALALLGCGLAVLGLLLLAVPSTRPQAFPWLASPAVIAAVGLGGGVVVLFALAGRAGAGAGQALVFADRLIHLLPGGVWRTVFFSDVLTFDDGSARIVRLRLARWRDAIHTPDEAGRTALLRALVAAGVPRDDGQPVGARAPLPPPRLVIQGRGLASCLGVSGLALAALTALLALTRERGQAAAGLGALVIFSAWFAAVAWLGERSGRAEARDERLTLLGRGVPSSLAWADVAGWRAEPGCVRLVMREGLTEETLPGVPTPTPADRAALEALLGARGIPRLSPAAAPPAPPAPDAAPPRP